MFSTGRPKDSALAWSAGFAPQCRACTEFLLIIHMQHSRQRTRFVRRSNPRHLHAQFDSVNFDFRLFDRSRTGPANQKPFLTKLILTNLTIWSTPVHVLNAQTAKVKKGDYFQNYLFVSCRWPIGHLEMIRSLWKTKATFEREKRKTSTYLPLTRSMHSAMQSSHRASKPVTGTRTAS